MAGRIENIPSLQIPIDFSSRLPQRAQEVLKEEGQEAVVVKDRLGNQQLLQ